MATIEWRETKLISGRVTRTAYLNWSEGGKQRRKSLRTSDPVEANRALEKFLHQIDAPAPSRHDLRRYNYVYRQTKKNAKRRGITFDLSMEDFEALVVEADGQCVLTGAPFDFEKRGAGKWRPWAPSLDRIDSDKGYELANCRLICVILNVALGQWGWKTLVELFEYGQTWIPNDRVSKDAW